MDEKEELFIECLKKKVKITGDCINNLFNSFETWINKCSEFLDDQKARLILFTENWYLKIMFYDADFLRRFFNDVKTIEFFDLYESNAFEICELDLDNDRGIHKLFEIEEIRNKYEELEMEDLKEIEQGLEKVIERMKEIPEEWELYAEGLEDELPVETKEHNLIVHLYRLKKEQREIDLGIKKMDDKDLDWVLTSWEQTNIDWEEYFKRKKEHKII